ncbi:MAG TPA: hypothetical protein DCY13_02190 [Verrucomicrobiales bacterium]|nr:hypothetical protein [Verrucomicrobiales bacterium]
MAYTAEISRANPSCFVFLIDQSGSMENPLPGALGRRKCDAVADAINKLIQNLIIKCARGEGVRDFYQVAVIGYGETVGHAFSGPLGGRDLVPLSEIANCPARIEERRRLSGNGSGGKTEHLVKFPVWFEPRAKGVTPMGEALQLAVDLLKPWIAAHPNSYPPIVINISDGAATDTGPEQQAAALRQLNTSDGSVLFFNCHISEKQSQPVVFPASDDGLPDEFARTLFAATSPLPEHLAGQARAEGLDVAPDARGFAFNADLTELIRFLDLGTRAGYLR